MPQERFSGHGNHTYVASHVNNRRTDLESYKNFKTRLGARGSGYFEQTSVNDS